jgi:hypothetical protein
MSSHEARREDAYGRTLNNSINVNAKWKKFFYVQNIHHETKPGVSDRAINALCFFKFHFKNNNL